MSRFFDALQRSQAERSGVDLSALPDATELAESVEQDAALEWETALRGLGKNIAQVYSGNNQPQGAAILASADAYTTPTITWPVPDPITYGTRLSTDQLCALAAVPGTFEYNPGLGAVLAAGEHELSVVFTPADTLGYSTSHSTVSLTVAKATPAITWPAPHPIACGAALSATQLNATATVPGSFAYTPAAGQILEPGLHELSVTFTPIDTLNYTTVSAVVPLTITEKLQPIITWPVPSAISYGTALSAIQLNATASVPGAFVYTPSEGHVLARGKYTLSASFTPSDTEKYATAQAAVVLQVEGLPDIASSPTAATETPSSWTFSAINLAPADFDEWDSEASPAAKPLNAREEWEAGLAAHSFSETPTPLGQSADREALLSPVVDRPRESSSASPAPVSVEQQELAGESVDGSPSRASHGLEASHATTEVHVAPDLPNLATVDEMRDSPQPAATLRREADGAPFQLFSSYKIKVKGERKTAKKKWLTVAAVSACSILLPLILIIPRLNIIPLFRHGTTSVAKPSVPPIPAAADTQLETPAPEPSAREPFTQEEPLATTKKQKATDNHPANEEGGVNAANLPTQMQKKLMDDQLSAPTRIPRDIEKPVAENAPPPVSFGTAGADGLGGSSTNAGIFNGRAQPVVKIASSKPITVSSGVATGMLIQSTPPVYPPIAKTAGVAGTVELHATISANGRIKDLQVVSGPPMLRQAAVDAVRNWRYKPYRVNNQPVEVKTTIHVVFALGR
jgi:TonB family protein